VDRDRNLHFLVMEYIDGPNLQEMVTQHGPLSVLRAAHYIRQAAAALQYAHEAGLVHRDIKPANLLVSRRGTVKLLDMGLARFSNQTGEVLTQGILGTPDYLAPEQVADSHTVDIRADIYSLGGTFYYLLTGATPFPEATVAKKLLWQKTREPEPICDIRPEVPRELAAVISTMMAKDRAQRYQTPEEIARALVPWTQTPIPPPAEHEMPRLSPAARSAANTMTDLSVTPIAPPASLTAPAIDPLELTPAPRADKRSLPPSLEPKLGRPSSAPMKPPTPAAPALPKVREPSPASADTEGKTPWAGWLLAGVVLVAAAAAVWWKWFRLGS
jgi:serine/threonine protein kinase